MQWYNALLNLEFLTTNFIEILKTMSLATIAGGLLLLILALMHGNNNKNTTIYAMSTIILAIYIAAYLVVASITILSLISYPATFMGALLKNFIINKYSLFLIPTFQEIILNIIVAFICCTIWFGFIAHLIIKYGESSDE